MRATQWVAGALSFVVLASVVEGQSAEARSEVSESRRRATEVLARVRAETGGNPEGAVIGVNTSSSGERDTLGLLVTSVTAGGPADKAGIEEGNRIAAVNGVNLKLSSADAGERDMHGMTTRRLVREMEKVNAGDAVELSVWKEGRFQTIRVQTIAREDLPGRQRVTREETDARAVVGLTLQTTGSIRDTLGPMIVRIASGGPAERAGLVEGDRIQSVNGTNLRVLREDAEEPMAGNAKVNRFSRVLRDLAAGDRVELQVYSGGQTRTLNVTTSKASEVYGESNEGTFFYRSGEGWGAAPVAPMLPMPPSSPGVIRLRSNAPELMPTPAPRVQVWRMGGVI